MNNLELNLYFLSTYFFLVLMVTSGISKILDPAKKMEKQNGILQPLIKLANNRIFAFVEILIGLSFVLFSSVLIHSILAVSVCTVVALGSFITIRFPEVPCNCFGSMTPKSKSTSIIIFVTSLLFTCLIISLPDAALISRFNLFEMCLLAGSIILIILFVSKSWSTKKQSIAIESKENEDQEFGYFKPETFLGYQKNIEILMSDIAQDGKPIFIVGVDPMCPQCEKLTPDIVSFARGFGDQFPIVIITSEEDYVKDEEDVELTIILDPERRFMMSQQLDGMPYAYIVYDKELKKMAPPTFGTDAVRMLFSVMLNARIVN